ncbi:MAG: phosphorylase, partial [Lachnospiraceae bacterium]|nr:phosphorylase [Lachnospiraceae bacterium]
SLLLNMTMFGATIEEICLHTLGVSADNINENVIVSPGWQPERLFHANVINQIVQSSPLFGYKIWNIEHRNITYIKTGFGAPVVLDALLLLGLTKCRKILFVSSVGALSSEMNIGDIVIPEYSASGDGAGRYLSNHLFQDIFGEKQYPHNDLFQFLINETKRICEINSVKWHLGKTFCTDTIVAQYNHLESIIEMGYNSIDMESAAAFKAAKMMNIPIAALLNVSDNSTMNKSLMTDHNNQSEKEYRKFVRSEIFPQIIENVFSK